MIWKAHVVKTKRPEGRMEEQGMLRGQAKDSGSSNPTFKCVKGLSGIGGKIYSVQPQRVLWDQHSNYRKTSLTSEQRTNRWGFPKAPSTHTAPSSSPTALYETCSPATLNHSRVLEHTRYIPISGPLPCASVPYQECPPPPLLLELCSCFKAQLRHCPLPHCPPAPLWNNNILQVLRTCWWLLYDMSW